MSKAASNTFKKTLRAISEIKPATEIKRSKKIPRKVGESANLKSVHLDTSYSLTEQVAYSNLFGSFFQRKAKELKNRNAERIRDLQRFSFDLDTSRTIFDTPYAENTISGQKLLMLSEGMRNCDAVLVFEPVVAAYIGFVKLKMEKLQIEGEIKEVHGEDLMACLWYNGIVQNQNKPINGKTVVGEGSVPAEGVQSVAETPNSFVSIFEYWTKLESTESNEKGHTSENFLLNLHSQTEYIVCLLKNPENQTILDLVSLVDELKVQAVLLSEPFLGGAEGVSRAMTLMKEPWKMDETESDTVKSVSEIMKTFASMEFVEGGILGRSLCLSRERHNLEKSGASSEQYNKN
jgi:hypothetical protein